MPYDNNERSPFWGIGSTTALLGGAAYAINQSKSSIVEAASSQAGSIQESVISAVAQAPQYNIGKAYSSILNESTQGFATSIASNAGLFTAQSDILHSAYESLLSTGTITSESALEKLAGVTGQNTILGSYGIATQTIQEAGGDIGVFNRRIEDLATGDRLSRLTGSAFSAGGFNANTPTFGFSDIAESFKTREQSIKQNILAAAEGRFEVGFSSRYGGTLDNPLMTVDLGGEKFNIPLNKNASQMQVGRSTYSLRQAYNPGGRVMSYSELMENTITDMLDSSSNQTQLRGEIHKANQTLIQSMKDRDSARFAAAIWSPPQEALTSGGLAVNRLRNLEAVGYGLTTEDIQANIGRGLYPYTSPPSAAKGVMSTKHLGEYVFGDLGLLVSPEARPGQFIRGEWGSTLAAKQLASNMGFSGEFGKYYNRLERKGATEGYRQLVYGGQSAISEAAYSSPQLMTFYAKPAGSNIAGFGFENESLNRMMAAEEGAISPSAGALMEHERSFAKRISLNKGLETNAGILNALADQTTDEFVPLSISQQSGIGVEANTGRRIELSSSQRVVGAQLIGQDEALIHFKETKQLTPGELLKTFSEEQKAIVGIRPEDEFKNIVKTAAGTENIAGQQIEQVLAGKLVQRNKMALITQQMEAMSVFAANKLGPGIDPIAEGMIRSFLEDPASASRVGDLINMQDKNAHLAIQKNLVGLARSFGFTENELAMTFGLADETALQEAGLTPMQRQAIRESSGVIGLGKGRVGDVVSGNWGRGSFEHTGFRLLSMKGEEGVDYAAELSRRILNKGELGALSKMEASILNEEPFIDKVKRSNVEDFMQGELIQQEGRYVNFGRKFKDFGGSDSLYIPGINEAPYTMSRVASGNKEITKPLEQELKYFRNTLQRFNNQKTTEEELDLAARGLRGAVFRATEEQAAARGKIAGSRIVTNIRTGAESDAYGLSKVDVDRMYRDLTERTTDINLLEELKTQRRSLEEGGTVASGLWRHPTTGPESFQFVKMRIDESLKQGTISVPYKEGKLSISGGPKGSRSIDLSAMTGLKADYDRDQLVIAAISNRETQKRVSNKINNEMKQGYASYLFNHYGMKDYFEGQVAKGDVLRMDNAEALLSGYKKLTTAKSTTGQVNLALQQFKLGLSYSAPEKYRPMAELFWHLEEAAIGGKHGVMGENIYQAVADAAKGGESGVRSMEQVLSSVFGGDKVSLTGKITTETGETLNQSLNFNVKDLARQAVESGSAVRREVQVAMDSASIAKGKSISLSLNQNIERMFLRKRGSVDVANLLMQANTQDMTGITSKAGRTVSNLENRGASILKAIKRNKKGLLIGGGIAAGMMFMAPSTSGTINSPNTSGGGVNLGEEELSPAYGPPMNPPPPKQNRSPRIYDVGGGRPTTHANISMRLNDLNSSSKDFMANARRLVSNGNVNIKAEDNRQTTDPLLLAKEIHERL